MARRPWAKFFPSDDLADTRCLSLRARGFWRDFIFKCWQQPGWKGQWEGGLAAWGVLIGCTRRDAKEALREIGRKGVGDVSWRGGRVSLACRRLGASAALPATEGAPTPSLRASQRSTLSDADADADANAKAEAEAKAGPLPEPAAPPGDLPGVLATRWSTYSQQKGGSSENATRAAYGVVLYKKWAPALAHKALTRAPNGVTGLAILIRMGRKPPKGKGGPGAYLTAALRHPAPGKRAEALAVEAMAAAETGPDALVKWLEGSLNGGGGGAGA